jgi:hypothetical protein
MTSLEENDARKLVFYEHSVYAYIYLKLVWVNILYASILRKSTCWSNPANMALKLVHAQ